MFGVPGQHTFFLPVDSAFDVSVQLTGYDYERGRPTGLNKMGVSTVINIFDKVGHIRYKCNTFEINTRGHTLASQKKRYCTVVLIYFGRYFINFPLFF
jgi:hypothetical protein